jgi:hypothetical protein
MPPLYQEQYENYYTQILEIFPTLNLSKLGFYIAVNIKDFDKTLSPNETIFLICRNNCKCFNQKLSPPPPPEYIEVQRKKGKSLITYKDAIETLIEKGYRAKCSHCFLQEFSQITQNEFIAIFVA